MFRAALPLLIGSLAFLPGLALAQAPQPYPTHITPNPTYAQLEQEGLLRDGNECIPVPTYRLGGAGLEPVGTQCADRPGQGKLDMLSPHSQIDPAMIIEVTPSTTIIIPHRWPGSRVWQLNRIP